MISAHETCKQYIKFYVHWDDIKVVLSFFSEKYYPVKENMSEY